MRPKLFPKGGYRAAIYAKHEVPLVDVEPRQELSGVLLRPSDVSPIQTCRASSPEKCHPHQEMRS